jgi:hypothetical protein
MSKAPDIIARLQQLKSLQESKTKQPLGEPSLDDSPAALEVSKAFAEYVARKAQANAGA